MTTGSTIRAMIKLLRKLNPMKVEVLVMAHTIAPKDRK
jgi:predicted amidophosphoribosyltransferase